MKGFGGSGYFLIGHYFIVTFLILSKGFEKCGSAVAEKYGTF